MSAVLASALGICAAPVHAQSAALLLGNAQITPGLQAQGFVITHSISQTATATSITYSVTPPPSGSPGAGQAIGRINLETVLPPNTFSVPVTLTATFTGELYIIPFGIFPSSSFGANTGTSPQQKTIDAIGAKGSLTFAIAFPTTSPSTLTLSITIGSPNGARLPYINDFSGDGQTELAVWRPPEGNWYVDPYSPVVTQWGQPGGSDVPVPGDFDGDGFSDYAVWRPSDGNWYVLDSSTGQLVTQQWGGPGDIPVPADYDRDGKTDFAVWRPSNGTFYVILSSTGQVVSQQWGMGGDIPVPGDYDGDGKADFAVWRPSDGGWYVLYSSTGQLVTRQWGGDGDIPVLGDYDRDGKTDFAVWRPSDGTWYIINSSNGQLVFQQWGGEGDIPIPGDYNGSGETGFGIWRPSNGTWYILNSLTGNMVTQQWGGTGDIPVGQTLVSAP